MEQWQFGIIELLGWSYFFLWSVSFYGQIQENYRLKNVEGMNLDFVQLNFTGYFFYSVYNTQGYFFSEDQTGEVNFNDAMFSYHALIVTIFTIYQSFIYDRGTNKIHFATKLILGLLWGFIIVYWFLTHYTKIIQVPSHFGVFTLMGYSKVVITCLKYIPQLYWNYIRRSTKGWSIVAVIFDFTGGLLSFSQMIAEQLFDRSTPINIVKLLLGFSSTTYNIFFLLQHYYWYGPVDVHSESISQTETNIKKISNEYETQLTQKQEIEDKINQ